MELVKIVFLVLIVRSVVALVSCYFCVTAADVIFLGLGALFLVFLVLSPQRVSDHSYQTLRELPDPLWLASWTQAVLGTRFTSRII